MQVLLENDFLKVRFKYKGAELCSVIDKKTNFEFIWQADPKIWNRHAPVLFPIVGKLNNNVFRHKGQIYSLGQHGFARDMDFAPIILEDRTVVFELRFNEETLAKYPFQFSFKIKYTLENNQLIITYIIENLFEDEMYYSVGGHPAFVLPYPNLSEYYIEFDKSVSSIVRHLLNNGLISGHTETLPLDSRKLRLTKEMFDKDAIVLKNDINTSLALKHINSNFKIGLVYEQFTDLGIWTKQGTEQFICLEPWVGYADREGYEGELKDKKGIKKISPNAIDEYTYKLSFNI